MHRHTRIYTLLATIAVLVVTLAGCKSHKTNTTPSYTPAQGATQGAASRTGVPVSATERFEAMTKAYEAWSDMTVPVKVSLTQPKKISLSGTLSMQYGKAMSLSMRMLFIDAGTLYADTDSVIFVSGPLKVYYAESLERFMASTGFSLADLQSLLLGQVFVPGKGTATAEDASYFSAAANPELSSDGLDVITLTPRRLPAGVQWTMDIVAPADPTSTASPQLFALTVNTEAGPRMGCTFGESTLSRAGVTAAAMQIEGQAAGKTVDAILTTSPAKAKWDSNISIRRPNIPAAARRLSTQQLLKALTSL